MVGVLNTPPPNPEDCKAFNRWVAHEVRRGAQIKSPRPHNINTVRNCSNCPLQSLPLARRCAWLRQPSQQPCRSHGCALSVSSIPAPTRGAAVANREGTEVTRRELKLR